MGNLHCITGTKKTFKILSNFCLQKDPLDVCLISDCRIMITKCHVPTETLETDISNLVCLLMLKRGRYQSPLFFSL